MRTHESAAMSFLFFYLMRARNGGVWINELWSICVDNASGRNALIRSHMREVGVILGRPSVLSTYPIRLRLPSKVVLVLISGLGLACGNLHRPGQPPCGSGPGPCWWPAADAAVSGAAGDAVRRPIGPIGSFDGGYRPRVIAISADGLGAYYLRQQLDHGKLPSFAALRRAGASTLNARADYEYTITLPNHTSMLTGLPVLADPALPITAYHGWTTNSDVPAEVTLHNGGNPNLTYIASVFDVVHDHGLSTCLYSGKSKFSLFSNSYGAKNGAPDLVGEDNGRNKIDRVMIFDLNTEALITAVEADLASEGCDFAFVHIADPDRNGHSLGWGSEAWLATLEAVDGWIGRLAVFADSNQTENPYFLVLTADHGGDGDGHSDETLPFDYTIPFFIVGPGVPAATDLYSLTGPGRSDPGEARLRYSEPEQPVRNADVANLVTHLLGLPPVPGALMGDLLR
jgi:hypothetical protein